MTVEHYQIGNVNTADLTENDIRNFEQVVFDAFCLNGEITDHIGMLSRLHTFQHELGNDMADDAFQWLLGEDCTDLTEERESWMRWDAYKEFRDDLFYTADRYSGDAYVDDFIDGQCFWYDKNSFHEREAVDAMMRFLGFDDLGDALETAMRR